MLVLVGFTALPLVYMVSTAFKPIDEIFLFPPRFFVRKPTLSNFGDLVAAVDSQVVPFLRYVINSLFTTVMTVVLTVAITSMGAYSVDKIKFLGRKAIFRIVILSLMFSPPAAQIPIYMAVSRLGMIDTYWALIVPNLATPMYFFLMKQFISQIPDSILESARIDGATEFRTYLSVAMPMAKAAISTVVVFSFTANWNNAGGSIIYITKQAMRTLPFAMSTISAGGLARAGAAAAAVFLTTLPTIVVYVFMQSRVIKTMAFSGIKG